MISIDVRYAQEKRGQKMHLVPVISGTSVASTAFCGKRVNQWGMTCNVLLGRACKSCHRIDRKRGYRRALQIFRDVINAEE